jgi:trehalose 6-phosphate phosphatase
LARTALFLDLDGTLIDFAPTPDLVVIPPDLAPTLRNLHERLDGAIAIVTGRSVDVVEALLPDAGIVIAGEHGAAIRYRADAEPIRPALPAPPAAWLTQAETLRAQWPGAVMERKALGFTLHYRQAPAAGHAFHAFMRDLVAADPRFQLLEGTMVWEIRPQGADKGGAVRALMANPPFAGRVPIFIGDDITDEDGMRSAREAGGFGLRVEPVFSNPARVRAWLARAARDGVWTPWSIPV